METNGQVIVGCQWSHHCKHLGQDFLPKAGGHWHLEDSLSPGGVCWWEVSSKESKGEDLHENPGGKEPQLATHAGTQSRLPSLGDQALPHARDQSPLPRRLSGFQAVPETPWPQGV